MYFNLKYVLLSQLLVTFANKVIICYANSVNINAFVCTSFTEVDVTYIQYLY